MTSDAVLGGTFFGLLLSVLQYRLVGRSVLDIMTVSGDLRGRDVTRSWWHAGLWTVFFGVVLWLPSEGGSKILGFLATATIGFFCFGHLIRALHFVRIRPSELEAYSDLVASVRRECLNRRVSANGGKNDPGFRHLIVHVNTGDYELRLSLGGTYAAWSQGDRSVPASEAAADLPRFTSLLLQLEGPEQGRRKNIMN